MMIDTAGAGGLVCPVKTDLAEVARQRIFRCHLLHVDRSAIWG